MSKIFMMELDKIQPSQLFICSEKLSQVMKTFDMTKHELLKSIPVKKLGNETIFVDRHTRALAAFLQGFREVNVYWEDEALDWDEYQICIKWCREEGIRAIADLKNRIIPHREYKILWLERCRKMQKELEVKRIKNE